MKIKVECRGEILELQVNAGHRLLETLQSHQIPVNAACGGNGSCQKCRVQIKEGFAGISAADKKAFNEAELAAGWRLSCQSIPRTSLSCVLPDVEDFRAKARVVKNAQFEKLSQNTQNPTLACDLGSTGVVVAIGNEKGESIIESHLLNRQVRFGADVMTRLKYAQDNGLAVLQEKLVESIELCLKALEEEAPELYQKALSSRELFCSGNSAIVSFLHAFDIDTLAVFPFQPLKREAFTSHSPKLNLKITTLPLLGGFVGADTFAGLYYLQNINPPKTWMLVDIGTNTEIVVNNGRNEWWFSSAPAGPAFEGGNIAQGMRAEPGAISRAYYQNNEWKIECIGNDKAKGICGSGLVDILFEATQVGLVSKDGFVPNGKLSINDKIALIADDIREFQLAKAATRTACDLLIERSGIIPEHIYLAGTFAEHLRKDAILGTGLLPPSIPLSLLGNASLAGTLLYAAASESERKLFIDSLEERRRPVELALQDDFQESFVKNLNF